ncbi:MAG: MBL fold metallo-hydrolase [Bacteroidales bacterium]|nr:MBL fold metallo-hydrolase [Bacteroidales bacterium]
MDRRDFIKTSALAGASLLVDWDNLFAAGTKDIAVGLPWQGWKKGHFQIHFIYTGVAESLFLIFPDGTSMLLDCGDHRGIARNERALPILSSEEHHTGEIISKYAEKVNPRGKDVDYMLLSHYHSDHSGGEHYYTEKRVVDGEDYFISGLSQAAEMLNFSYAIDRCWPTFDDPIPLVDDGDAVMTHMRKLYSYLEKHRGVKIEKFDLGSETQVRMLHNPGSYKGFSVRNICSNGRIITPEGEVIDLYAERKKNPPRAFNENGMSTGMIFSYGPFRFFTAGDFSDYWNRADGTRVDIEDELGKVIPSVNVAKLNHHGYDESMTPGLVSALRAQVYVSCIWGCGHDVDSVLTRLADRNLYPGNRVICPTLMPVQRRKVDWDKVWMKDVSKASFDPGHVVVDVQPGGRTYTVSYLETGEDLKVRSVMHFDSVNK